METANKYDDLEDDEIMASNTTMVDNLGDVDNNYNDNLMPVPSIKLLSSTEAHIKDIEKLKENTSDLLDPSWKEQRNKQLIGKMLELEEPAVTPKMVDFMVQDGVCEAMLAYVTRLNTGQERYFLC
jgi:hypothetical protein